MLFYGIILGCIEVFKVSVKRILITMMKEKFVNTMLFQLLH